MRDQFRSKGPELLLDLADHVAVALVELASMEQERAIQLGRDRQSYGHPLGRPKRLLPNGPFDQTIGKGPPYL